MQLPVNFTSLVETTANYLDLVYPAVIEKDYYVTKVLHALADVENDYYHLVFIGGTCLAKAHRIVQRMSEDIDFKIIPKAELASLGKSKARDKICIFRQLIPQTILRDRERFKGKSPHFYQNTLSELQYGLKALETNAIWAKHYADFLNNLVFQKERPEFRDTLETLSKLTKRALDAVGV